MANLWTYEQKFNDLNTASLGGQDSWNLVAGVADVVTTGTPYPDPTELKHVFLNPPSGDTDIRRTITGVESGTMYISLKKTTNNSHYAYISLLNLPKTGAEILMIGSGQWEYNDGPTWIDTGSYSANTYYRVGIAFECGAGGWEGLLAGTYKWNIDNGSWNGPYDFYSTSVSSLNLIRIGGDGEGYFDYISPDYVPEKFPFSPFPSHYNT